MLSHPGGDLLRVLPDQRQVGADDLDRDRRQRAEAHDLGHDITRLETEGGQLGLFSAWSLVKPPCSSRAASHGNHLARAGPCGAARETRQA